MDWVDALILALRIALVALLYLFLVFVMRAARRGLLTPVQNLSRSHPMRLKLVVVDGGASRLRSGEVVELDDGGTLGRTERADLVLADPTVSSEHARVNRVGRAWVVMDLGSTNGTTVNATRVSGSVPLADGDVLALGGVRLRVAGR